MYYTGKVYTRVPVFDYQVLKYEASEFMKCDIEIISKIGNRTDKNGCYVELYEKEKTHYSEWNPDDEAEKILIEYIKIKYPELIPYINNEDGQPMLLYVWW